MTGTAAIYILDSSFFLSGMQPPEGELFTVSEVVDEVRPDRKELGFASALGLSVLTPNDDSIHAVEDAARKTGDISRMSTVDVQLVALAFQLSGILLTDDYSMQNTARSMNVDFRPLAQQGIRKVVTWYHRCRYCGQYQEKHYEECPTCAGPMKTTRKPPAGTGEGK